MKYNFYADDTFILSLCFQPFLWSRTLCSNFDCWWNQWA